jgi:hypothetical protein
MTLCPLSKRVPSASRSPLLLLGDVPVPPRVAKPRDSPTARFSRGFCHRAFLARVLPPRVSRAGLGTVCLGLARSPRPEFSSSRSPLFDFQNHERMSAEEEGFEPPVLSHCGFQDRRLKPLGHSSRLSALLARELSPAAKGPLDNLPPASLSKEKLAEDPERRRQKEHGRRRHERA